MKDTTFWISPAQKERLVQPYIRNAQSGKLQPTPIDYMYGGAVTDRERPPLGGAGLFSTVEDVARFYQMMLNRGAANGRQILKPETVAAMTRKQTGDLRARAGMPWGPGFCVVEDPTQTGGECDAFARFVWSWGRVRHAKLGRSRPRHDLRVDDLARQAATHTRRFRHAPRLPAGCCRRARGKIALKTVCELVLKRT